jgi:hypothetical protein
MYDHTSFEEDKYGFTGFLHSGAASYSRETRREFALRLLFCSTEAAAAFHFPAIWKALLLLRDLLPGEYSSRSSMKNISSFWGQSLFFTATLLTLP